MFKPIKTWKFFSIPVLPTVYGEALSYLEDIDQVREKLNNVIEAYNTLIEYYNGLDGLLEEMQETLKQLESEIEQMKVSLQNQFDALKAQIEQENTELSAEITNQMNELSTKLQQQINVQIAIITEQLAAIDPKLEAYNKEMQDWVKSTLNDFIISIPDTQNVLVVWPDTGELISIQEAIDKLYQKSNYDAMTFGEYDSLGLTCKEYDDWYDVGFSTGKGVTCGRYEEHSKSIFYDRIRIKRASPVSGKQVKPIDIMRENSGMIRSSGALTGQEYTAAHLSADAYKNLNLTALQYSYEANKHIS